MVDRGRFHDLWNFSVFRSLRKNRVEWVIFIVSEWYETYLKQCYFWLLFGGLVYSQVRFFKVAKFSQFVWMLQYFLVEFYYFCIRWEDVDWYVRSMFRCCGQRCYVSRGVGQKDMMGYFRPIVQQKEEGYTLDLIQYYISFLKVLFQKCEQYFSLFIVYYGDSIRIIFLFTGCIIYLLYLFVVQTSEVQYLVLGVLYSRCLMLYIQLQELYTFSIIC